MNRIQSKHRGSFRIELIETNWSDFIDRIGPCFRNDIEHRTELTQIETVQSDRIESNHRIERSRIDAMKPTEMHGVRSMEFIESNSLNSSTCFELCNLRLHSHVFINAQFDQRIKAHACRFPSTSIESNPSNRIGPACIRGKEMQRIDTIKFIE